MSTVPGAIVRGTPSCHSQSSDGRPCVMESCRVVSCAPAAAGIFLLRFESRSISRAARPGQFVHVMCGPSTAERIGGDRLFSGRAPVLRRPLSVCSTDPGAGTVDLMFRVVGPGTGWLSERVRGDRIDVMGPLGRGFSLPGREGAAVLAAGGIGVAPLVGWARALAESGIQVHAVIGARTDAELAGVAQIRDAGAAVTVCTDDGSRGFKGSVCDMLAPVLRKTGAAALYACGPVAVLKAARDVSARLRVFCEVSVEDRLACGIGACVGCAVPRAVPSGGRAYFRACSDGPVFAAHEIVIGRGEPAGGDR